MYWDLSVYVEIKIFSLLLYRCIPLNYVCNRFNNCGDNSDEYNCYSLYGRKRDEISSFTDMLLQDGGDNSVDAANGTLS